MNFEYSEQSKQLQSKLNAFINEHLIPLEGEFLDFQKRSHNRWKRWPNRSTQTEGEAGRSMEPLSS